LISKTLNFTGRKKIESETINLLLLTDSTSLTITGTIDLSSQLPEAPFAVYLDVYRQTYRVRVLGEATSEGVIQFTSPLDPAVSPETLLCEIKVLQSEGPEKGKILAIAERIRPKWGGDAGAKSLLPQESADLGQRIWRLDTSEDQPVLQFNNALPDWRDLASGSDFQKLVYPEVVRGIAAWLLETTDNGDPEHGSVVGQWQAWFESVGKSLPEGRSLESDKNWIDDCAQLFAEQNKILDKWMQQYEAEAY